MSAAALAATNTGPVSGTGQQAQRMDLRSDRFAAQSGGTARDQQTPGAQQTAGIVAAGGATGSGAGPSGAA
jgi:hypothetical protein